MSGSMNMHPGNGLSLYATPSHECSYLEDRRAVTVFVDPLLPKNKQLYTLLSQQGFRRSGEHLYRPGCGDCRACVPVRLPIPAFQMRRRHRRVWNKNQDLSVHPVKPAFSAEHFALYHRYISGRHRGGGMDNPTPGTYMQFLTCVWSDTLFYEFREQGRLIAIAVVDRLLDGLSAVYTFFDPAQGARSLGTYAVLWEIEEARRKGLDYLYLGYWIKNCRKMRYKSDYQPLEYYVDGLWRLNAF